MGEKKLRWASFWACKFSTLLVDVQTVSFILAGFPQSQPCEVAALTASAFSCFKRKILVMHFCQKPHSSHIQLSLFLANELNPCLGFHTLNSDRYWENVGWRIKEHWCYLVQPRDCPMSFCHLLKIVILPSASPQFQNTPLFLLASFAHNVVAHYTTPISCCSAENSIPMGSLLLATFALLYHPNNAMWSECTKKRRSASSKSLVKIISSITGCLQKNVEPYGDSYQLPAVFQIMLQALGNILVSPLKLFLSLQQLWLSSFQWHKAGKQNNRQSPQQTSGNSILQDLFH